MIDNKYRGRGDAVIEQIVNAVSVGNVVVRIGQNRVACANALIGLGGSPLILYGQGDNLRVFSFEFGANFFQLHELAAARASAAFAIENKDY